MQSKRLRPGFRVPQVVWELVPFNFGSILPPGFIAFDYMAFVLVQQRFYRFKKR